MAHTTLAPMAAPQTTGDDTARATPPALAVDALRRSYESVEAVKGISFEIRGGEIFGLLGPNGAGKTTTISMLSTRLRPSGGSAAVFGHDLRTDVGAVRRDIGLVPQEISIYPALTAAENVRFFGQMYGVEPRVLAERTLAAIREGRFWVLPPDGDPWREAARLRNRSIDTATNPVLGGPLAGAEA